MTKNYTWQEFKQMMIEAGVKDSDKIAWIDCNGNMPAIEIDHYSNGDVKVSDSSVELGASHG